MHLRPADKTAVRDDDGIGRTDQEFRGLSVLDADLRARQHGRVSLRDQSVDRDVDRNHARRETVVRRAVGDVTGGVGTVPKRADIR